MELGSFALAAPDAWGVQRSEKRDQLIKWRRAARRCRYKRPGVIWR
jgi:hypothetical protein